MGTSGGRAGQSRSWLRPTPLRRAMMGAASCLLSLLLLAARIRGTSSQTLRRRLPERTIG